MERAALDVATFIRANLPVAEVPSIPELRLHRAGPQSGLRRLAETDAVGIGSPYWAYSWAGGLALARHVLDRPETVRGRQVLDLGAGSGLVGIAAMKAGAARVIAAEVDPCAVAALHLNAALNGIALEVVEGDLTAGPPPDGIDLVLVGDLFYAADLAARVMGFLDRCLAAGAAVLIGDPRRAHLPLSRLRLIADYPVADFGDAAGAHGVSGVFALEPNGGLGQRPRA